MSEDRDIKSDLTIDPLDLEYEWLRQATLFQEYSEEYANAARYRDQCKQALEIKKAEIELDVREDPGEYGYDYKPTESTIKALVTAHGDVKKLTDELNEAAFVANRMYGIKTAFDQKKSALESLSRLYLAGYYGEPKIPAQVHNSHSDRVTGKITEGLKDSPRMRRRKNGE